MCEGCHCCKCCGRCDRAEGENAGSRSLLDGYGPWARFVMALGSLVASSSLAVGYFAFLGRVMLYPGENSGGLPWGWIAVASAFVVMTTWAFAYREGEEPTEAGARQ